jgi:hypothetical protein
MGHMGSHFSSPKLPKRYVTNQFAAHAPLLISIQHIRSKWLGTHETPTQYDREQFQLHATICLSKLAVSSLRIFIVQVSIYIVVDQLTRLHRYRLTRIRR